MPTTLLIVEDDQEMRELCSEFFVALGFRAESCGSLAEALDSVREGRVDAVLTDVGLGPNDDDSGIALCRGVAQSSPDVAVFVLSGDAGTREAALSAGARGFWLKPADLKAIALAIRGAVLSPT
jgi:CheY-like chemotaxis protein